MAKRFSYLLTYIPIIAIFLFLAIFPLPVQAGSGNWWVFEVNTFEDIADIAPNGLCDTPSGGNPWGGPCSLRSAVSESRNVINDMNLNLHIKLPPGTYQLTLPTPDGQQDSRETGDLDFDDLSGSTDLITIIEGTGGPDNPSIIDANFIDRIFQVGEYHNLVLQNLILRNGRVTEPYPHSDWVCGGGIYTDWSTSLSLAHVRLTNNEAKCIYNDCISSGGGIFAQNDLSLIAVEMDHNKSENGSAIVLSGGQPTPPKFNVYGSAIHDNLATRKYTITTLGNLRMVNTTVANNTIPQDAPEIFLSKDPHIQNSTLTRTGNGPILDIWDGSTSLNLRNSILISLPDSNGQLGQNCLIRDGGILTSEGGNLLSDDTCRPIPIIGDKIVPHQAAGIAPLAENGGPVPTIALRPGSPAVDILPSPCLVRNYDLTPFQDWPLLVDAREIDRDDGACDSGAYELHIINLYAPLIRK